MSVYERRRKYDPQVKCNTTQASPVSFVRKSGSSEQSMGEKSKDLSSTIEEEAAKAASDIEKSRRMTVNVSRLKLVAMMLRPNVGEQRLSSSPGTTPYHSAS